MARRTIHTPDVSIREQLQNTQAKLVSSLHGQNKPRKRENLAFFQTNHPHILEEILKRRMGQQEFS